MKEYLEVIRKILKIYRPKRDNVYNKQLLLEIYETIYGIFDHTVPGFPLASSSLHPKENVYENNIYENRLRKYLELKIHERTGLNFIEFLDLPRAEVETILKVTQQFEQKVDNIQTSARRKAEIEAEQEARKADAELNMTR